MKKIINEQRKLYFLIILTSVITSALIVLFAIQLGNIIDVITKDNNSLTQKLLISMLIIALNLIFNGLASILMNTYITRITHKIKSKIYENFYNRNLNELSEQNQSEYINTFIKNTDIFTDNYLIPRIKIYEKLFLGSFSIISIFIISWQLAISLIIISICTILVSGLPSKYMIKKTNMFSEENKNFLNIITKYINGFEQIKLLNIKNIFSLKLNNVDKKFEKVRKDFLISKDFSMIFSGVISLFSQIISFALGVYFASKGYITVGMLIASTQLLNSIFDPIGKISNYKNLIKTCKNIIEDFDSKLEIKAENLNSLDTDINEISFENIGLKFNEKVIFDNFSKTFNKNNVYALIGKSGTGKSSLAKLLLKYYKKDLYDGNIKINGNDLEMISSDSIYSKIAYIQKNDFLLEESIENNILLGREKTGNFNSTLELLNINSLSNKTDNNLSFGEKQRVDIARFIINDYDVYIFDEPTSNLDPETSKLIYEYIFSLKNKIVIVITHNNDAELLDRFSEVIRL